MSITDSRKRWCREQDALNREVSAAKMAAGMRDHAGKRSTEAERGWRAQMGIHVPDTRDLTGQVFGDPIPGDPRAPWRGLGR